MWVRRPPVATWSAGAAISASSAGPSSGTATCRGVREVSDARRRASVTSALAERGRRGRSSAIAAGCSNAVAIGGLLSVAVHAGAGQLQVDVVERRGAGRDLAGPADLGEDVAGAAAVQRNREPGADRERVVA